MSVSTNPAHQPAPSDVSVEILAKRKKASGKIADVPIVVLENIFSFLDPVEPRGTKTLISKQNASEASQALAVCNTWKRVGNPVLNSELIAVTRKIDQLRKHEVANPSVSMSMAKLSRSGRTCFCFHDSIGATRPHGDPTARNIQRFRSVAAHINFLISCIVFTPLIASTLLALMFPTGRIILGILGLISIVSMKVHDFCTHLLSQYPNTIEHLKRKKKELEKTYIEKANSRARNEKIKKGVSEDHQHTENTATEKAAQLRTAAPSSIVDGRAVTPISIES